ncbi:endonuclease/exonuclease/phosphatase family protein [uncultured Formosa sp.]|uniref:endonuclease/exonuclease/phosphatase family protein n=1 Tax=uncultured Formosa sp. TaxID=255435 RepID=UPI00260C28A7|nr:endonuclease/exonuclease/phosphatase family protein [uncultured Formosa sp.]
MKKTFNTIDIIGLIITLTLLIAILSSYFNWGWISVIFSIFLPLIGIVNIVLCVYGLLKKKYLYLIGTACYLLCFSFFYRVSKVTSLKSSNITTRIVSFNTKGFSYNYNGEETRTRLIKFLDSIQPDILVLQESNYPVTRKFKAYKYNFNDLRLKKGKSLLSIYSKFPIVNTGYIDFTNTKNNAIYADILVQNDTIRIYNLHLQSHQLTSKSLEINKVIYNNLLEKVSLTLQKQINQSRIVRRNIDKTAKKIIVCGDFNTPQYALPYRILKQDLQDSFIEKGNGFGTTYSLKGFPLRLDYFLMDKKIEVLNHINFNVNLSDHEPILVDFKIRS